MTETPIFPPSAPAKKMGLAGALARIGRVGIALTILAFGAGVAVYFLTNKPQASRAPQPPSSLLVEAQSLQPEEHTIVLRAMGTIIPSEKINLIPRVGGQIISIHEEFIPGGFFRQGESLMRIDPRDYELAVSQKESELAKAENDLALEMGRQEIAQQESDLLKDRIQVEDMGLILRRPQLRMYQAAVEGAKSSLEKALLDLERTNVLAPFNAMILSREVNLGSQVSTATRLAELVGTDEYWVEVSVPVDDLQWIDIPRSGSETTGSVVRIYNDMAWGRRFREGNVLRLTGQLEEQGRMARLLIAIKDPLCLEKEHADQPELLLGQYVRAEIEGRKISNAFAVPRSALRDGEYLWIMTPENTLEVRKVELFWRGRNMVYLQEGVLPGERLIVSDLAAPVEGMSLRMANATTQPESSPDRQPAEEK